MKKILFTVLFLSCYFAHGQTSKIFKLFPGTDYLPGVVIVKFKPAISKPSSQSTGKNISDAPPLKLKSIPEFSVARKFTDQRNTSSTSIEDKDNIGIRRIYELKFTGNASMETVINELLQDERIEYAEPEYIFHSSYTPNDPFYPRQNWLSQVKAPQAWDIIRNASGIIIAIVDSGSELLHSDLASNIYINTSDPVNGIDDDRDGYIDNNRGWDFVGASASQIIEDNDPNVKSSSAEHGIHVSGIASAATDNNIGISSIAFNAKLMIIKAGADDNGDAIYRGYDGIKYAADHGAQIINCSWGSEAGGAYGLDIINYARSKGCLITAAAGNSNTSMPEYPAAYPGVMAVANINGSDIKSTASNYGSYIAVSAPGSNILSTTFGNSFGTKSGTSMAAPMVASAAALVKSFFPTLTMQQVGEKLRATADAIDAVNPAYAGQLGKGRINVYRALTEATPSVRKQKLTVIDTGNGSIPAGQTVSFYIDLKNFLSSVANLQILLSCKNPNVTITTASQNVPSLGTLETKTLIGPFNAFIKPGTPDNLNVLFRLDYSANNGAYQDFETFDITVALDYLNIEVNKIATTLTSNGRVGYSSANATNGLGFSYFTLPLLYEASLMVGTSSLQVSNNARNGNNGSDEHFIKQVRAARVPTTTAAFEGRSEFDDSGSPKPLNLYIKHRQIAYATAPDDKYSIAEYEIANRGTTDLTGLYIGLLTDWDIDDGSNNLTRFDAANRIGYVQRKTGGGPIGAVKLLSTSSSPAYYPLSYAVAGDPLADGTFTMAEKFQTLASGIKATSLGDNTASGYDVMFVSGYGPYNIPAKSSVTVAFAFIGGDDIPDVQKSAAAAQLKYNVIKPADAPLSAFLELKQNFPNPFPISSLDVTSIQYSIPLSGKVNLSMYNLMGKRIKTYVDGEKQAGLYTLNIPAYDLESGIYIYRLRYNNEEKALKMSVVK